MGEKAKDGVSDSEFHMWRAVFAFSLVDNVLTLEEQKILKPYLNTIPFSPAQADTLKNDFKTPQNVEALYRKITDARDKGRFCVLARALAWCEGDFDKQEVAILKKVSCLAKGADDDVLARTRKHPHVESYHRQYATAGMMGLFRAPPTVSASI